MSQKALVWVSLLIGSTVGGYVPTLWGADLLSVSGIVGSVVGGLAGIWGAYKLSQHYL